MKYIKRAPIKVMVISIIVVATIFSLYSISKDKQKEGLQLTEFEITYSPLDSVTNDIIKISIDKIKEGTVVALSFEEPNDTLHFVYSFFHSMHELSHEYVFHRNYRILGYLERKDCKIVVLTNMNNNILDMLLKIEELIRPLDKTCYFDDIYYKPMDKSNWGEYIDGWVLRCHYKYYDGKIHESDTRIE